MGELLKGKVALITGGGRGLGREIAIAYAEEGADVAVAARTTSKIEAVADEIRALDRKALAIPTDVRLEDQVNQMVGRTLEEFGKIDILVTSAGGSMGSSFGPVYTQSLNQWQIVFDVNLTGAFISIKAVVPQMITQKSGSILNLSSWVGQPGEPIAGFGAYSITKWSIEGLTHLLALELAEFNIRVNALRPGGPTATPDVIGDGNLTEEQLNMFNQLPHGPLVRPEIVRPLALFLASDESAGITRQSLDCKQWNLEHGFGDASQYRYSPDTK